MRTWQLGVAVSSSRECLTPPPRLSPKIGAKTSHLVHHTIVTTPPTCHHIRSLHRYPRPNLATMKLLTLNFLTCAIKTCKTNPLSFPLHPRDSELEIQEADVNLPFLKNILPRLMWEEIRVICREVRTLATNPTPRRSIGREIMTPEECRLILSSLVVGPPRPTRNRSHTRRPCFQHHRSLHRSRHYRYYTLNPDLGLTSLCERRIAVPNSSRSASHTSRDMYTRGQAGLWELRTRICG
jgi:hypothetical protein